MDDQIHSWGLLLDGRSALLDMTGKQPNRSTAGFHRLDRGFHSGDRMDGSVAGVCTYHGRPSFTEKGKTASPSSS
jgi:hypothetical protein